MSKDVTPQSGGVPIRLHRVCKSYQRDQQTVPVLQDLSLDIAAGSFVALMGPSGSGKSTLLNLIAGLDRPSSGRIEVNGQDLVQMSPRELCRWRARNIGIVFQMFNLLPVLTALQNVELPLLLSDLPARERRRRAETALRVVGLSDRMSHHPRQLSGGQEQRVAIARAIVSDPKVLVADEPTGNLDRQSAEDVLSLLSTLHARFGKTIVLVTHDPAAASRASELRQLDKGLLLPSSTSCGVT
ncbi:MAG: ABC transporter ATP-binding protein [Polyangia bacterium]